MKKTFLILAAMGLLTACNNSGSSADTKKDTSSTSNMSTMSSTESKADRNRQTALASVQAANAHDANGVLKDASTDIVDYGDGSGKPAKNIDSLKAGISEWLKAFPDVKGDNLEAFSNADGSKVIVVGEWTGTFKGDLMGMKPTGKSFKYWDGDLFTFNDDGKITSHRGIQSFMTTMNQVGAKMPK
jgi:predicted ester cyclase